jgi:hypothetical protein
LAKLEAEQTDAQLLAKYGLFVAEAKYDGALCVNQ